MYWLPIIAILVAARSLAVGLYERLWLNVWKPFRLSCEIRGVIWQPPARPETPFSIVVPLALTPKGVWYELLLSNSVTTNSRLNIG